MKVDPVCGGTMEPEQAAAYVVYRGSVCHFCASSLLKNASHGVLQLASPRRMSAARSIFQTLAGLKNDATHPCGAWRFVFQRTASACHHAFGTHPDVYQGRGGTPTGYADEEVYAGHPPPA